MRTVVSLETLELGNKAWMLRLLHQNNSSSEPDTECRWWSISTGCWNCRRNIIKLLFKRWLGQTAEAMLVHGSVLEDEGYLNPQNYYTKASNMLGCLRTAWKYQYWICVCSCSCPQSRETRGREPQQTLWLCYYATQYFCGEDWNKDSWILMLQFFSEIVIRPSKKPKNLISRDPFKEVMASSHYPKKLLF